METTVRALEAVHARLLAAARGPHPDAQALMALAASVPQLVGAIESRLPKAGAIILSEAAVRELLTEFACDLLLIQVSAIRPQRRARPLPF